MEYRKLGNSDLEVSSIGLGCVTFGREIDEAASFLLIDHALEHGINLLDTAEVYAHGASENVIGSYIKKKKNRDNFILATKKIAPLDYDAIIEGLESSLQRLQTDHVDLYQLHVYDQKVSLEETFRALDKLTADGKVRFVGCSNFTAENLKDAFEVSETLSHARFVSIQPNYNLVARGIEQEILPFCQEKTIGVLSYSPLGAGFLTGKFRKGETIPGGTRFDVMPAHQDIYFKDALFEVMEGLRSLADESGLSMIHLALRWVMTRPGVSSVLTGGRHIGHVDQAINAAEAEDVSDALLTRLTELSVKAI